MFYVCENVFVCLTQEFKIGTHRIQKTPKKEEKRNWTELRSLKPETNFPQIVINVMLTSLKSGLFEIAQNFLQKNLIKKKVFPLQLYENILNVYRCSGNNHLTILIRIFKTDYIKFTSQIFMTITLRVLVVHEKKKR